MANSTEDFGFSFHDESEIEDQINEAALNAASKAANQTEQTYKQKLAAVEAIVIPFLQNLMKDPDKVMIRWPNRKEVVEKQLKKILLITQG
jgi:hypothetical protein